MSDAEKVVKALRAHCTCPRVAGMECGDCARWDALADFVEAATNTREYLGSGGGFTVQCMAKEQDAALARLLEVLS